MVREQGHQKAGQDGNLIPGLRNRRKWGERKWIIWGHKFSQLSSESKEDENRDSRGWNVGIGDHLSYPLLTDLYA